MTQPLVDTGSRKAGTPSTGQSLALAALLCTSLSSTSLLCASRARAEQSNSSASIDREPAAAADDPPSPAGLAPTAPSAPDDSRWLAWTAVGVGGGLLAVSAWQWIVFANRNADAGGVCPGRSGELARCVDAEARARYVDARDDAKQARVLGALSGGLGAAALVTGILLFPDTGSGSGQPSVALSGDPMSGDARASVSWIW